MNDQRTTRNESDISMTTTVINDARTNVRVWADHDRPKHAITLGQLRELVNSELSHLGDDVALVSLEIPERVYTPEPRRPGRLDFVFTEI